MKKPAGKLVKFTSGITAALFGLGVTMPALFASAPAFAAQLNSRSIQLSSATPGATGTSYKVTFTPQTTEASGVVYVDFCSNSPLEGDTCSDATGDVPNTASVTGPATTTSVSDGTTAHTVKITGQTLTSGTPYTATLANLTNPTATASFYARVYTGATGYTYTPAHNTTPTDTGFVDFGGVAISTNNVIGITARVQETLQFCVLSVAPTDSCANASGSNLPNITLGHGANKVLDGSVVDTAQVFSQLSTNAFHGAVIQAHLNNACGGLSADGGTTCNIAAVNGGGSTSAAIQNGNTTNNAVFGMHVDDGTSDSSSPYVTVADANYKTNYGMDTETVTTPTSVTGTFGDPVAASSGATSNENNTYTFAATATPTTPAGVYTAQMSLIATGTF